MLVGLWEGLLSMGRISLVSALIVLAGCSAVAPEEEGGVSVPGLDAGMTDRERSEYFRLVGLEKELPRDFIGCLEENQLCYVFGSEIETELRFEPQSGRYWFLDPESGNTYFFNGDLRTGDPALMVPPEGRAELPQDEEDHTG
jgi:hypothetical protein